MNRGFLCIAYAMLCHSVAYTATIHRFTRTSVLELGKATLSQILLPNNIYRLNIILMAKLQLLAIITLDGYLFDRTVSSPLWDNPNKYGLTKIRERATQTLGPDVSFISLTQWKKKNESEKSDFWKNDRYFTKISAEKGKINDVFEKIAYIFLKIMV